MPSQVPRQLISQLAGPGQGSEVAARDLVDFGAEPLPRHPALELEREEPVGPSGDHPGGHVRPSLDLAGLAKGDVRLGVGVPLPRGHHLCGHVVQEVGGQIEIDGVPARLA